MSLGIIVKGPEGIVLAADSRVTLFNQIPNPAVAGQTILIPATFDNATKVLRVNGQNFVGAVTYGLGAFITPDGPRTMQSFIPEFEEELKQNNVGRLPVADFANRMSDFFMRQWNSLVGRPANLGEELNFLVGGYDDGAAYGRGFLFTIPNAPIPIEQNAGPGQFGITWGGQTDLVYRLLFGFDPQLPSFLGTRFNVPAAQIPELARAIEAQLAPGIPYQFLPLQDCVSLAVFLIQGTIDFQQFRTATVRGVGGTVEVAIITRSQAFTFVSQKKITLN
jgi:hypothetical protein